MVAYTLAAEALRHIGLRRAHIAELGWLVAVGVVAGPFVAATGVTLTEVTLHHQTFSDAFAAGRTFWTGDAATIATFVPFMLIVAHTLREGRIIERLPSSFGDRVEAAVQGLALVLVPLLVLFTASRNSGQPRPGAGPAAGDLGGGPARPADGGPPDRWS